MATELNVQFFLDYKEAVKLDNVDLVVILTPLKKKYIYENIEVLMNIDWRENKNHKFSNFFYEEGTLFVHHTAQDIWMNAERLDGFDKANTLDTHYTNLFKHLDLNFDKIEKII